MNFKAILMRDDDWDNVDLDVPFQQEQSILIYTIQKWHYAAEKVMGLVCLMSVLPNLMCFMDICLQIWK